MRSQLPAVAVWLLDLDIGGRVYRYSTVGMDVPASDGTLLAYLGGLGEIAAAVGQDSIAVSVMDPGVDWEGLVLSGQPVEGARATLRRLIVGDAIETAVTYASGWIEQTMMGAPGEDRLSATLRSGKPKTSPILSGSDALSTWPASVVPANQGGGSYAPWVAGSPGRGLYPAWPGVYVEDSGTSYVLVSRADGAIAPPSGASVHVWDTSGGGYEKRSCLLVQIADTSAIFADLTTPLDGAFTTLPSSQRQYHVGVRTYSAIGAASRTGTPVRGLGDLLIHIAQRYAVSGWDLAAQIGARDALNRYEIDAVVNTPVDAWTWVQSVIVPLVRIERRVGKDGLYLVAPQYTASNGDSIASLVTGTNISRLGGITVSNDVYNDFTIKHSPNKGAAQYLRTQRITGDPAAESDLGAVRANRLCRDSFGGHGLRVAPVVQTRAVWSSGTASLILDELAMRHALPWYQVEYTAPISMEWLREGDIVTVTDRAFVDRLAILGPVVVGASSIRFTAKFFPLPLVRP